MKKVLLKETKIGQFLTIGAEVEGDEVGIFIASADVSASCAFKFDEWEKFIAGINKADEIFKERLNE
ncbi:MAG: hypothetical protein KAH35_05295 [Candidatus Atribacteria bacterium]|nr:hypothetical protein [Candidatus Atribacteria bacterium]